VTIAYINRIATGVPRHDVHNVFVQYAISLFNKDERRSTLLERMAERAGIEHRYSCLQPAVDWQTGPTLDTRGFYVRGRFPDTAARMRLFEAHAPELAAETVERLELGAERDRITHLLITSCTGFSAPGLDLELIERCRLSPSVERTMIGFMGCYAAINALKLARHIVRSEPDARVLVLNLELCTLHMQETSDIAQMLCFLLFADGCAACVVSAEPRGLALESFKAVLLPNTRELMSWHIRGFGFDMVLSGQVPAAIHDALHFGTQELLGSTPPEAIDFWAMHPGGRSILDSIERAFDLDPEELAPSREVLRRYGNMSSAAVMFVLDEMLRAPARALKREGKGLAMSFGPGLVAETMQFRKVA
jgi:predicted naringenin-chalcone synthase